MEHSFSLEQTLITFFLPLDFNLILISGSFRAEHITTFQLTHHRFASAGCLKA